MTSPEQHMYSLGPFTFNWAHTPRLPELGAPPMRHFQFLIQLTRRVSVQLIVIRFDTP